MNKKVNKFLEFNGKTLYFLSDKRQYWIALKPICESLGVNWARQHTNLLADPIYAQLSADKQMVAADGKLRKMTSLSEEWIYGWIMQIQSNSPNLIEYKKECNQILFKYFHGTITGRKDLLGQKAKIQAERDQIINNLDPDIVINLERVQKQLNQINAELRKQDNEVLEEERDLFSQ